MQTITLGDRVPAMSRLIYGVWRLADDPDKSQQTVVRKVETCLDQGITTFDHADIYGDYSCEALFGAALKDHPALRHRMQTITKCDIMLLSEKYPDTRVKHYDTTADHIRTSVDRSLTNIGVDVIDLLLLHRPDPLMDHHETGAALDALIDEGKVRGVGVSNFMPWDIELLQSGMKHPVLTNQIEISLLNRVAFTNGQIAFSQRHAMPLQAWSSLAGGMLFDATNPASARLLPRLDEIGAEQGVDGDAVALAWLMAHPARIMPVIGTNNLRRLAKAADAMKVTIDRQTWFELWTLAEGHEVP